MIRSPHSLKNGPIHQNLDDPGCGCRVLVEHWWFDVEVLLDKTSSGTSTHVQLSNNSFSKGTNKIIKKI